MPVLTIEQLTNQINTLTGAPYTRQEAIQMLAQSAVLDNNKTQGVLGQAPGFETVRTSTSPDIFGGTEEESYISRGITPTPGVDIQELRAQDQSWGDKVANGVLKATTTFGTSAVEGLVGLPVGLVQGLTNLADGDPSTGFMSGLYDNPVGNAVDAVNDAMREALPNYYTQAEQEAGLLSRLGTTNFWADKFMNGAGYLAGAYASGLGLNKFMQLSKLGLADDAAREIQKLGTLAESGDMAALQALGDMSKTLKIKDGFRQFALGTVLAHGESSVEARETLNTIKDQMLQLRANGEGVYANMSDDEIEEAATSAGNINYLLNMGIVGGSNFWQLGKSLAPNWKSSLDNVRKAEVSLASGLPMSPMMGGTGVAVKATAKELGKYAKTFETVKGLGMGAIPETIQEGMQFAGQKGAEEYFLKKYNPQAKFEVGEYFNGLLKGVEETVTTTDGLESMLLGALLGGPMGAIQARGQAEANFKRDKKLEGLLNMAETSLTPITRTLEYAVLNNALESGMVESAQANDVFQFKNLEFDRFKTWVRSVSEVGGLDILLERLEMTKDLNEEDFKKFFGYNITTPLQEGQKEKTINKAIEQVKKIAEITENINFKFGDQTQAIKDVIFDAATNFENIDQRSKELSKRVLELTDGQVNYDAIKKTEAGDYKEILKRDLHRWWHDATPDKVDETIEILKDLEKLDKRREKYIKQYNEAKTGDSKFDLQAKIAQDEIKVLNEYLKAEDKEFGEFFEENTSVDDELGFQSSEFEITLPEENEGETVVEIDEESKITEYVIDPESLKDVKKATDGREFVHLRDKDGKKIFSNGILKEKIKGSKVLQNTKKVKVKFNEKGELIDSKGNVIGAGRELLSQLKSSAVSKSVTQVKQDIINKARKESLKTVIKENELVLGKKQNELIKIQEKLDKVKNLLNEAFTKGQTKKKFLDINPEKPIKSLIELEQIKNQLEKDASDIIQTIQSLTEYNERLEKEINSNKDFDKAEFKNDLNRFRTLQSKYSRLLNSYKNGIEAVTKAIEDLKALIVKFYPNFESTFQELMSNFNLDVPTDFANASLINNVLGNLNKRLLLLDTVEKDTNKNIDQVERTLKDINEQYLQVINENKYFQQELEKILKKEAAEKAKKTTTTNVAASEPNNKNYDREWESAKPDVIDLGNKTAGRHVNKDGSLNSDPSQVRYFETVAKLNPNKGKFELQVVTPTSHPHLYTPQDLANHSVENPNLKVIVLLDGEPINSKLEKLGPNPTNALMQSQGIYTSLPLATLTTEEFGDKFTNKTNKTEEEIEAIRANYETWRNEVNKKVNEGNIVRLFVTGKGKGVLNREKGVFKSLWKALGLTAEKFKELSVKAGNENDPDGAVVPGLIYVTTPEGNVIPMYGRTLNTNEVDVVVNTLKALANDVESVTVETTGKAVKTKLKREYFPKGWYYFKDKFKKFRYVDEKTQKVKFFTVYKDSEGNYYKLTQERKTKETPQETKLDLLQDVLKGMIYFTKEGPFRFTLSGGKVLFGTQEVDLNDIASVEEELRTFLATKNLNVDIKTLEKNNKHYEITAIDDQGNVEIKTYSSYKHYLFSDEKGARDVENIPLTTDVVSADSGKPQVMSSYLIFKGAPKVQTKTELKNEVVKESDEESDGEPDDDYYETAIPLAAGVNPELVSGGVAGLKQIFKGGTNTAENVSLTSNAFVVSEEGVEGPSTNVSDFTGDVKVTNKDEKNAANTFGLFKLKITEEYNKGDVNQATQWLNEKLGIPVEVVNGLIDNKAFGQFINNVIKLSTELEVGTEYHEAFHAVFRMFLNPQERAKVLAEAKLKYDAPTESELEELNKLYPQLGNNKDLLTNLYYEEKLADDFQEYVLAKQSGNEALSKIADKSLTGKIKKFFQDLWKVITGWTSRGKEIDSLFDKIESGYYKGQSPIGADNPFSVYKTLPNLNSKNAVTDSKVILDNLFHYFVHNITNKAKTIEEIESIPSKDKEAILIAGINAIKARFIDKKNPKARPDLASYLENNPAIVLNYFRNDYLSQFNITLEETVEEQEYNKRATGENNSRDTAYSLDASKINPKEKVSNYIKLLLASTVKLKKDGTPELNPDYNLIQLEDYQKLFNFIAFHLNGMTNFDEMVTKLNNLKAVKPSIENLLRKINVGNNASNLRMKVLFQQAFSQSKLDYQIMRITRTGDIVFNDPNFESLKNNKTEKWLSDFKSQSNYKLDGTTYKVVTKNIKGFPSVNFSEFDKLYNYVNQNYKNETLKTRANLILKSLGFGFSSPEASLNEDEYNALDKALHNIHKSLQDGKSFIEMFKIEERGNITNIVEIELNSTEDLNELSHIGPDGETRYGITQNNLFSLVGNTINRVKSLEELKQKYPHLFNVYNENSLLLKKGGLLFDSKGIRNDVPFNISIIEGVEAEIADGTTTDDLKFPDKILLHLNSVLRGLYPMVRTADKSLEYGIQTADKLGTGGLRNNPIINLKSALNDSELLDKYFAGYIQDEINRYIELVIYGVGNDVQYYTKNVRNNPFTLTSPLLVGTNIESLVKAGEKLNVKDYLNKNPNERNIILENLNSYLNNLSNSYVTTLNENKLINGINKEYLNAEKLSINNTQDVLDLARLYITNSLVMNIEQHKVFYGDPAFYKSMEDEFKRTAGAAGTKKMAFVDNYISKTLDRLYPRKDGKTGQSRNKIKSITLKDIEVKSRYYEQLKNSLVEAYGTKKGNELAKAYSKINEADAQGYITLDEYRDFLLRAGEWTGKHNKAYEKIIKGESLSATELFYFNPLKAQYFGPQVYKKGESSLYIPTYQKYSLMPLIPSIIKDKNLSKFYDSMVETQTGIAVYNSGKKVGALLQQDGDLQPFYSEGEVNPLNNNLTYSELNYEFLGIQVDIAPKVKDKTVFGTQFRRIIASFFSEGTSNPLSLINYGENGEVLSINESSSEAANDLKNNYTDLIGKIIDKRIENLTQELGFSIQNGNYVINDLTKVVESLKKQAQDRQAPDNIINAIDSLKKTDTARTNIETLPNKNKLEQILYALVNNDIILQKVNGSNRIQAASTGFEQKREFDAETGQILSSPDLRFYTKGKFGETLPAQIKIALPKKLVSYAESIGGLQVLNSKLKQLWELEYDAEGNVIGGARYSAEKIKQIGLDPKIFTFVGYRIPTQGYNSLEMFEIQEFLDPVGGEVVVVPSEIVAKSGSDFDIDKLFILEPNYRILDKTEYKYNLDSLYNFLENYIGDSDLPLRTRLAADRILRATKKDYTKAFNKILSIASNEVNEEPLLALAKFLNQYSITSGNGLLKNLTAQEVDGDFDAYSLLKAALTDYNSLIREGKEFKDKVKVGEDLEYITGENEQSWLNQIIENSKKILSSPEIFIDMITPNEVSTLKALSEELKEISKENGEQVDIKNSYSVIEPEFILNMGNNFLVGKAGVGISALQLVNHLTSQIANIGVNKPVYFENEGYNSISREMDSKGIYKISSIISEFINGYVDVAKDPFIFTIGASTQVADVFFYLIRRGIGIDSIVYFMNQPIIKEYIKEQSINESLISKALGQEGFKKNIVKNLINKYQTLSQSTTTRENSYMYDKTLLKNYLYNANQKGQAFYIDQVKILNDFLGYQEDAKDLSRMIRNSVPDTNTNKNFNSALLMQYENERFRQEKTGTSKEGELRFSNFNKLYEDTFLKHFKTGQNFAREFYKELYKVTQSDAMINTKKILLDILYRPATRASKDDIQKILDTFDNDFITYLLLTKPLAKSQPLFTLYKSLLTGDKSLAKRIIQEIKPTEEGGNNNTRLKGNLLIKELYYVLENNKTNNILDTVAFINKRLDTYSTNLVTDAFEELLQQSTVTTGHNIATDLIVVALMQSGISQSAISFLDKVPYKWYNSLSKQILDNYVPTPQDISNYTTQFFLNNHQNDTLVPKVKVKQVAKTIILQNGSRGFSYPFVKIWQWNTQGLTELEIKDKRLKGEPLGNFIVYKAMSEYNPLAMNRAFQAVNSQGNGIYLKEYYPTASQSMLPQNIVDNTGLSGTVTDYNIDEESTPTQSTTPTQSSTSVEREYTPENITELQPNEVFVFGSNPLGINGNPEKYPNMSASRATANGWVQQGEKMDNRLSDSGKAWGITTVTGPGKKKSKTPEQIGKGIQDMLLYAKAHPELKFLVTKFGTENAGWDVPTIKSLFEKLRNFIPNNVILPKEFEVRTTSPVQEENWTEEENNCKTPFQ